MSPTPAPSVDALSLVTPVVLTRDETPNLARTLASVAWARDVLVVDSGSTDGTLDVVRAFPNARAASRPFDTHGRQWAFAVSHPSISTPYVLALDADMSVGPDLVEEIAALVRDGRHVGGIVPFAFSYDGERLLGSFYPPQLRLFDRTRVEVVDRGHTQEFRIEGPVRRFRARALHDDRKPVERQLLAQVAYSRKECERIRASGPLRLKDRLRRAGLLAPLLFVASWLRAGGPFRGRAALRYAHERAMYESMLTLRLLRADTDAPAASDASATRPS